MISTRPDPTPRVSFARSVSPTPSDNSFHESHPSQPNQMTSSNTTMPQNLLTKLEGLLLAKAEEIQLAGRLGENLLGQQAELEERIKELSEVERVSAESPSGSRRVRGNFLPGGGEDQEVSDGEKEVGVETKKKLTELEEELKKWDEANSELYHTVGMAAAQGVPSIETLSQEPDEEPLSSHSRNGSLDSSGLPKIKSTKDLASQLSGAGEGLAASRRTRNNGQHRANDIELATEIGTSLLVEIRRLQALVLERDEQLKEGKEERNAVDRELEGAHSARRTIEESVDKYKEENWNLELASQELRTSLVEATSSLQKSDAERTRITKDLSSSRDLLESQRSESEKLTSQLESLKAKHETDMATMRKHSAGLQREKSDLISSMDLLKVELSNKNRGIKRIGSSSAVDLLSAGEGMDEESVISQDEGEEVSKPGAGRRITTEGLVPPSPGDLFSEYGDDSLDGSPARNGTDEGSLKLSLAHAQRTISTLKNSLAREKAARLELRRQIGGDVSSLAESEEEDDVSSLGTPIRPSPMRNSRGSSRGRGASSRKRGGGGMGVPSRLGREFSGDRSIDEDYDEEGEQEDSFDVGAGGSLFEHHFPSHEDDNGSENGTDGGFDSPLRPSRASIDMDPDYAHMMNSRASIDSSRSISSLASHQQGGNLASDLDGLGTFVGGGVNRTDSGMFSTSRSVEPIAILPPAKVWADAETMTDPQPIPEPIPVYIPPPSPQVVSIAIQTTPEPIVVIATSEKAGQTEPELVIQKSEIGTSTDPLPSSVEFSTSTDKPQTTEMEIQTDAIVPVIIPITAVAAPEVEEAPVVKDLVESEDAESKVKKEAGESAVTPLVSTVGVAALGAAALGITALGVTAITSNKSAGEAIHEDFTDAPKLKANGRVPFAPKGPTVEAVESPVEVEVEEEEEEEETSTLVASRFTTLDEGRRGSNSPDQLLEESAATASAFLGKNTTPNALELSSVIPLDATSDSLPPPILSVDKGKGPAPAHSPMGPPPIPLKSALKPTRPTSPPPADLLHRAQTSHDYYDNTNRTLIVPGSGSRSLRNKTSAGLGEYGLNPARRSGVSVSNMSIHSDVTHRMSMASSRTSDGGFETRSRGLDAGGNGASGPDSTDPAVIHAITQTMIGEFLYKYTRRTLGKGISEKRHKRFFWIHPYTKTLYWSAADHGGTNTSQSSAKSVFIEGVREVIDSNPYPAGLHSVSIVVQTPNREMKFTAPTKERHEMWLNAINYLLARPENVSEAGTTKKSPLTQSRINTMKRGGTLAADYEKESSFGSPRSIRTFASSIGGRDGTSLEIIEKRDVPGEYEDDGEGYEGLENVRACCGGAHDVGSLTRNHHHYHHHDGTPNSSTNSRNSFRNSTANYSRRVAVPSIAHSRKQSIGSFVTAPVPSSSSQR